MSPNIEILSFYRPEFLQIIKSIKLSYNIALQLTGKCIIDIKKAITWINILFRMAYQNWVRQISSLDIYFQNVYSIWTEWREKSGHYSIMHGLKIKILIYNNYRGLPWIFDDVIKNSSIQNWLLGLNSIRVTTMLLWQLCTKHSL